MTGPDFSPNEIKLFTKLGLEKFLEIYKDTPIAIYDLAVYVAFIKNSQGNDIDALRRGFNAIQNCNPYRMTPEFEKLIEFSEY